MVVPIFITGIGTDVGKTLAAAVLVKALDAAYWKPVQAGLEPSTDAQTIIELTGINPTRIFPSTYNLALPASPHIAARKEAVVIEPEKIKQHFLTICEQLQQQNTGNGNEKKILIVEGAGGLLVPLSESFSIADLVVGLNIPVVIVSRNYLGSINHSLLTAEACRSRNIKVAGWLFNDVYGDYTNEIVSWTGIPALINIPATDKVTPKFVAETAASCAQTLKIALC